MSARSARLLCATALVVGAGVRLVPCWNDFWLDEVWSWGWARELDSWVGVFRDIHHSNNNHLNTWFLYVLGDRLDGVVYRMPSWLAGSGSIALAAVLGARRGRLESVFAAVLTAGSFALIHFSSEARGYSVAVFCALLALRALQAELDDRRPWGAPVFACAVTLGLLSHLVFAFFWAGALAQSGWRALRDARPAGVRMAQLLRLHAVPALALAGLWWVDLRYMVLDGGDVTDFARVSSRFFGFVFGLPVSRALAWPYAAAGFALLALALARLVRRGDDAWILYAVAIVVAPLAAIGIQRPEVVAVRYFLIGAALALLLASDSLADGVRAGGARRALALACTAAFLVGNAIHTAAFLEHGRGGYRAAIAHMAERTSGDVIWVSSDHDFRTGIVLLFHERSMQPGKQLAYRFRHEGGAPVEWLITHEPDRPERVPPRIVGPSGHRYALSGEFDHGGISGFFWAVYRIESQPPRARPQGAAPD